METTELTCIACPKGCRIRAAIENGEVAVTGNACARGKEYARSELICPVRMVTTTILARGAKHCRVSVRTASPVPKGKVPQVLAQLHQMKIKTPVAVGEVVCRDVAGTHVDVIATKALCRAGRFPRLRALIPKRLRLGRRGQRAAR